MCKKKDIAVDTAQKYPVYEKHTRWGKIPGGGSILLLALLLIFGISGQARGQTIMLGPSGISPFTTYGGIENLYVLQGFNHYGSCDSIFFMGKKDRDSDRGRLGLAGLVTRGQSEEEDATDAANYDFEYASPSQSILWGGVAYTHINAPGYTTDEGFNQHHGYSVERPGFLGGLRRSFSDTFSGGILFVFSTPRFLQKGNVMQGFEDWEDWIDNWEGNDYWDVMEGLSYRTKVDIRDFQFALHFEKIFLENWEICGFLGGGAQWFNWNRAMRWQNPDKNIDYTYHYHANLTGNSLTATVYLGRKFDFTQQLTMRAIVGIDSEHSWIHGLNESGAEPEAFVIDGVVWTVSGAEYGLFTPQSCEKVRYTRNIARAGLRFSHESLDWRIGSNFQVFYGYTMNSDKNFFTNTIEGLGGHTIGRHSLTLGGNLHAYLDSAESLMLQMDYNATMYAHMTAQNVSMTLAKQF